MRQGARLTCRGSRNVVTVDSGQSSSFQSFMPLPSSAASHLRSGLKAHDSISFKVRAFSKIVSGHNFAAVSRGQPRQDANVHVAFQEMHRAVSEQDIGTSRM